MDFQADTDPSVTARRALTRLNEINAALEKIETASPVAATIPPGALVKYVDYANGSDSNSGSGPGYAMKTIQAAYDAGARVLVLMPGRHDVLSGVLFNPQKPVLVTSLFAHRGQRYGAPSAPYAQEAVVFSSRAGIPSLFGNTPSATIGLGYSYSGIVFDMSNNVPYGALHPNINHVRMEDCGAFGPTTAAVEQYVLSNYGSTLDASWWRMRDCNSRNAGLAYLLGDGHSVSFNHCYPGIGHGVVFEHATRSGTFHNCIESVSDSKFAILLTGASYRNIIFGDGGEAVKNYVGVVSSSRNIIMPIGNLTYPYGDKSLVVYDTIASETSNYTPYDLLNRDYGDALPFKGAVKGTTTYVAHAHERLVELDASQNNVLVQIPDAAYCTGTIMSFRRVDNSVNTARVRADYGNGGNIEGSTSGIVLSPGETVTLLSAGTVSGSSTWKKI